MYQTRDYNTSWEEIEAQLRRMVGGGVALDLEGAELEAEVELAWWRLDQTERTVLGMWAAGEPLRPMAAQIGVSPKKAGQVLREAKRHLFDEVNGSKEDDVRWSKQDA